MMLSHDCPYCETKSVAFTPHGEAAHPENFVYEVLFTCNKCHRGIVATIQAPGPMSPSANVRGDVGKLNQYFGLIEVNPKPPSPIIPEHIPKNIERSYSEAGRILSSSPTAAVGMFRRSIDLALRKEHFSGVAFNEKESLYNRIESLVASHHLTQAIGDWAHSVRLDGNEALHAEPEFTATEAAEIGELTEYILRYVFTLPISVEAARNRRNPKPQ